MSRYRIKITARHPVPQNIGNPVLEYIEDKERKSSRLRAQVFYDDLDIGVGVILDFYKHFEIIEDFGYTQTRALNRHTHIGSRVYKLKYYRSPPLPDTDRKEYLDAFTDILQKYVEKIKSVKPGLGLTYIPSSRRVPDDIAYELGQRTGLEVHPFISINQEMENELKNIEDMDLALELCEKKYLLDEAVLHPEKTYIIIDDIIGYGASIITILKKLYHLTNRKNYFLVLAKDVKR